MSNNIILHESEHLWNTKNPEYTFQHIYIYGLKARTKWYNYEISWPNKHNMLVATQ